jgi:hypothetical protein
MNTGQNTPKNDSDVDTIQKDVVKDLRDQQYLMISKIVMAFAVLNFIVLLVIVSLVAGQPTGDLVPRLPGVMPSLSGKPHLILA